MIEPSLKIAVSGSSGLVGSQLGPWLQSAGNDVIRLVRTPNEDPKAVAVWDSDGEARRLDGIDAVIHLAGKPIGDQRWNDAIKRQIRDSRVQKTELLCQRLAELPTPPRVLLCASAVGIYGDRGDEVLTENSPLGNDFLADVAQQWEAACEPARSAGIRVVHLRFGVILSPQGGALARMRTPAKFGGGRLGSGAQWWSWIAIPDVLGGIRHALAHNALSGPVNFTAPGAVRNRDFAAILGRVLHRPAMFPAPAFVLRSMLGEMADALLLASARVVPERLVASGYEFRFPELDPALRHLLSQQPVA